MAHSQPTWLRLLVFCFFVSWMQFAVGADSKVDPTGTWKWERTRGENTRKFTLKIKTEGGKITGSYIMRRNETDVETEIKEAKLYGDQLSFQVDREFNDRKFTITMNGKVGKDTITGAGEFSAGGNSREFEWNAKRYVGSAEVVGTWQFRIETNNGNVLEPTLKITEKDGKLAGMYTGRIGDREVKNLEIKGNQLTFEMSGERDGDEWKVDYKAHPRGDLISGTIDFDFGGNTGTIEFEGKRKSEKK